MKLLSIIHYKRRYIVKEGNQTKKKECVICSKKSLYKIPWPSLYMHIYIDTDPPAYTHKHIKFLTVHVPVILRTFIQILNMSRGVRSHACLTNPIQNSVAWT